MCEKFKDYKIYSSEQLQNLKTRQLLGELRSTYSWGCPYCWEDEDWEGLKAYRACIKVVLSTREHIPNKIESKKIRIARKKKGN